MTMRFAIYCAILSVILSVLPAMAKTSSDADIHIIDYGIYSTGATRIVPADNPMGHTNQSKRFDLLSLTDKVPAVVGSKFGFSFEISERAGRKFYKLTRVIKTPRITNPANGKSTEIFRDIVRVVANRKLFAGYIFEYEWELAPGDYTVQLFNGKELLAEKTFHIYKP